MCKNLKRQRETNEAAFAEFEGKVKDMELELIESREKVKLYDTLKVLVKLLEDNFKALKVRFERVLVGSLYSTESPRRHKYLFQVKSVQGYLQEAEEKLEKSTEESNKIGQDKSKLEGEKKQLNIQLETLKQAWRSQYFFLFEVLSHVLISLSANGQERRKAQLGDGGEWG